MSWLNSIDAAVFRWINQSLSNPVFDWLMPFLSGNPFIFPTLAIGGLILAWKGGRKGRLFLFMLVAAIVLGDSFVCNTIKEAIGRPRPFNTILDAHVLVGRGASMSMPSAHATNWFAATMIAYVYYRRSVRWMLPLAVGVAFSRIYNGVHYPSDVLVGTVLGAGSAAALVWTLNALWQIEGKKWFPLWWIRMPSLLNPDQTGESVPSTSTQTVIDQQWLRLGYLLIAILLLARLLYLGSGQIELSEDEAYQWTWSKHLALSYYSKPPLIAYTQFLGTALFGDTELGVRFFSPVIAAILSLLLLRFLAQTVSVKVGLAMVLVASTTPLLSVGATLMTIDPLLVMFWIAAMITGWRAIQQDSTKLWLYTGLWMGLGFLSKYTELFQIACFAVFFVLWKPARGQLRRPGPYLALAIMALCATPVLIWNYQHGWITVAHVASDGALNQAWKPTMRFFWDFMAAETGLLNPVFFIAACWAAVAFWRRNQRDPLLIYFFSMGAPLFIFFWLFSFHSRVLPNWIAPSVLPLFCLMSVYWFGRWRAGVSQVRAWLSVGLALGCVVVVPLHDTDLLGKIAGHPLPPKLDPLRRVRAWKETARIVGAARDTLLAEGKPVFIIGDHYGIVGQLSFYLPEAKAKVSSQPLVYYESSPVPVNQYFFWPGYRERKGENAIYVRQTDDPTLPPSQLQNEFESIKDLGIYEALYHGRIFRRIQLFECRHLQ